MKNSSKNSNYTQNLQVEQKTLDKVVETMNIPNRTMTQLIEYLIIEYGAISCEMTVIDKKNLKANVIMVHFPEVLEKPFVLPNNPTKEQRIDYCKKDTSYLQARNYPSEKLKLIFKSYILPISNVIVELEMTTQYIQCQNDDGTILDDLFIWKGLEKIDIDKRSPKFIAYVKVLQERGKL